MISVAAARKIINDNAGPLAPVKVPLQLAAGLFLAEAIYAATDIPSFNQSSVDGYAICYEDWKEYGALKTSGEIPAGKAAAMELQPKQAIRIFTGAPVPAGADTVVMQEKTSIDNGLLHINDLQLQQGSNVRLKGSEIMMGELALGSGSLLSPAAIGFLAGIGVEAVVVTKTPAITIIVTGNELQQPGKPLVHGQVYESNSYTLAAALQQQHISSVNIVRVHDELDSLVTVLNRALDTSDMVLLTGGVSVGDYDFVPRAATACGVTQLFHRLRQKPGKPLYFGKKDERLVFGLPGNPSSVLTCFYEYVLPALHLLNPAVSPLKNISVPLGSVIRKPAGLSTFFKGIYDGHTVTLLGAQESFRLSSFAKANCLICMPEEATECREGDIIEIHLLPESFNR